VERGDILLVSLDPSVGAEQTKVRPAVVVSSNAANSSAERRGFGVITIVPLTSNVVTIYPFNVLIRPSESGLLIDSKAQAEQVRSISTTRIVRQIGAVSAPRMRDIEDALRLHLSL
jgi:mRNA interferase MazF